jgi:hypothetical protein
MNINRKLKPDLVDQKFTNKISRTLNQPKKDYWKPTKNFFQQIYADWIEPNFYFFAFALFILLLLLCRYRMIQTERLEEQMMEMSGYTSPKANINTESDESQLANIVMGTYHKSKEMYVEPKINTNKYTDRVTWAGTGTMPATAPTTMPALAYPMYPYSKGGALLPANSR